MNKANTKKALAALVRSEREKRNWTQEHLAAVAGVSPRTIQRLGACSFLRRLPKEIYRRGRQAYGLACRDCNGHHQR